LPIARALLGESGRVDDLEVRLGNKVVLLEVFAESILGASGEVEYAIAVLNDITARELAERRLDLHHELFEKLVEIARISANTQSLEPTLYAALRISSRMIGAERGSIFLVRPDGVVAHDFLAKDGSVRSEHKGQSYQAVEKGLSGWVYHQGRPALVADVLTDERWVTIPGQAHTNRSALIVPIILGEDTLGVMGLYHTKPDQFDEEHLNFLRAVSDQVALALHNTQLYEDERRLADKLAQAEETAGAARQEKNVFLSRMSNELRTPLMEIIGENHQLSDYSQKVGLADFSPRLDKIDSLARTLLSKIDDVLDFSKVEAGRLDLKIEAIQVVRLVTEINDYARPMAELNENTLLIQYPDNLGEMFTDRLRLRQILLNLLDNACKFTSKGAITLSVRREVSAAGDWMRFAVADSGIGMTPEQVQHLFQAFTPVDQAIAQKYGGAGLGLVYSRQLARKLGGEITVTSEIGKGSTFTLRLPCSEPAPQ
jgi:two-component system, sensor histidine kinase LadS